MPKQDQRLSAVFSAFDWFLSLPNLEPIPCNRARVRTRRRQLEQEYDAFAEVSEA